MNKVLCSRKLLFLQWKLSQPVNIVSEVEEHSLKSGSFVHSTVSLCLRTNCGNCRPNRSRHFRMLSSRCPYKLFVFAVIMANVPVGFPVPQMQEGLDEREALDYFILDYIDYCTVMGWFERKDGCQYDDQSEDGKKQWKKQNLCM